ncbi:hypothetical protein EV360DRAFT_90789 [Lentinula raphanica]|nr:hypothetical protein EV360DRAFT_90789 [Lentinula raphanica]
MNNVLPSKQQTTSRRNNEATMLKLVAHVGTKYLALFLTITVYPTPTPIPLFFI